MFQQYRRSLLCLFPCLFLLALNACGGATTTTSQPSQTPGQLLASSGSAMSKLKNAHVVADVTSDITAKNIETKIATRTSGDEIFPDQFDVTIAVTDVIKGQTERQEELRQGNKVYIQNRAGKWFVIDKSLMINDNGLDTLSVQYRAKLFSLAEEGKLTDHGLETVNGKALRHITSRLNKEQAQELGFNNGTTLDFWIEETTSYTYHIMFAVDTTTSTIPTSTSTSGKFVMKEAISMDYSAFDKQGLTITPPTDATPVQSIQEIPH